MEIYQTEEQELEAIKRWWKDNSQAVTLGIALGAAVLVGWNIWQARQRQVSEEASALYMQMSKAIEAKQKDAAQTLSDSIAQKYGSTAYASFARLTTAKLKAENGDLAGARQVLEKLLLESSVQPYFKHLARLRLGQVLLASNQAEAVMKILDDAQSQGYGAFEKDYWLLEGDAQSALGKTTEARQAYQEASRLGARSAWLEMKLEDLGGTPSTAQAH